MSQVEQSQENLHRGTSTLSKPFDATAKHLLAVDPAAWLSFTEVAEEIWTSTFILMGLRYSAEQTEAVLKGVLTMKESVTLHAVLEQGRAEGRAEGQEIGRRKEAVDLLLKLGRKRLGPPDPRTIASIEGTADLARIEQLLENVVEVASWDELFPASNGAGASTNH